MDAARKDAPKPRHFIRGSKYDTLLRSRDIENQKRRHQFCRKVKQNGEERRWDIRTEQILRTDFLLRQKQWEEEQVRRAAEVIAEPDEYEDIGDEPCESQTADRFQALLSQEEEELAEISSMLDEAQADVPSQDEEMSDYGSDEEDYSQLLIDAIQQVERTNPDIFAEVMHETLEMDTTTG